VKRPYWFTRDECLALHEMMLSHYGGIAGIRDDNLLGSALARPQQLRSYGKPTMADMAAAYAFGIVKNHPFFDGNKRTGFMMCVGFLERNDYRVEASEVDATMQTRALAAGEIGEADYASWLAATCARS
jgi:death-on-curing protein